MEIEEVKLQMKQLWKDTFNDTDDYISIIFDSYFNPDLIEYHEEDGRIVSALVGVPYTFASPYKECVEGVKGLYLCGLATRPEARGRGLITMLMNRIWRRAKSMGYAFSFLIPASEKLRKFYYDRGMTDAFFRRKYTLNISGKSNCNFNVFKNEILNINGENIVSKYNNFEIDCNEYFNFKVEEYCYIQDKNLNIVINIFSYLNKFERDNNYLSLLHSFYDFERIVHENFISGGRIIYCYDRDDLIVGVAVLSNFDDVAIDCPVFYSDNDSVSKSILNYIAKASGAKIINIYTDCKSVTDTLHMSTDCKNVGEGPYGMIRILNPSEILKFVDSRAGLHKFPILVKDEILGGECNIESAIDDSPCENELEKQNIIRKINTQELADGLFDVNSQVGLPHVIGRISLMLD